MSRKLIIIPLVLLFIACGKKNNPSPSLKPSQVLLSTPAQNSVCVNGTNTSALQSNVLFSWNAGLNTNSYNLVIKNLLTSDSTKINTTQTQTSVYLSANTPYSWHVVSLSSQTSATAQSDTWKFYIAGAPVFTYVPFPAEIISPTFGQQVTATAGSINLSWSGSAVASDKIVNYDVYLGTTTSPSKIASLITDNFLNKVSVVSKTTYYWKIISRNTIGNTSDSGLYQFTVK